MDKKNEKPFVVITELINSGTQALRKTRSPQNNILTGAEGERTLLEFFGLKSIFLAWADGMMSAWGRRRQLRLNVDAERLMGMGPKNYCLSAWRDPVRTEPKARIQHPLRALCTAHENP